MAEIGGVPMVQRVWDACLRTGLRTLIATDDDELMAYMKGQGAYVAMTGEAATGSDRCAMAAKMAELHFHWRPEIVVNVQADMPFLPPAIILAAVHALKSSWDVAQWASLWAWHCVTSFETSHETGRPTFSRWRHKAHIGVYAFKRAALEKFASLPQTEMEKALSLEQWRLIENNISGVLAQVEHWPLEVNTPEDLAMVNACR